MSLIERPVIKERNFLNSIIILILKLEVFFIPLFFLPLTFEIFEFSKQNLLWFLTFLAAVLWLVKSVVAEKKIIYKRTPLDLAILIFLVFWGLSTIFSVDWFASLFGYYGRFSDAYLSTISFAFFYFLFIQSVDRRQIKKVFNIFFASLATVFIISLAAISGLTAGLPGGTGVIRSNSFNPVGGSAESLALAAAATLVLVTALYSYNVKGAKKAFLLNIKYYILFGLSFATLLMVNNSLAWIALAIGLGAIFSFALYIIYVNRENKDSSIEIAIAPALTFFIFSILFLFLFAGGQGLNLPRLFFKSGLPQEVVLSASRGKSIVWESFKDNPLFGSGPGTFAYDFSQYRPASFNSSQFWQLRFDKAPMHFLELAATVGLLGVLSYLAFIGIFLFISFVFLRNMFRTSSEESYLAFAFSFAAFTLFIIQALYLTNTALMFFFWLALVMAMANWRLAFSKIFAVREIDLKKHQDLKPLFVSFTIVAAGFCLFFFYVQAKYYIADAAYNDFRLSGNRDRLVAAAKLNPRRLNYRIALAKDYINAVKDDVNLLSVPGGGESLTPEKREKLQLNIQQAIKEGEAAISLAPNSVIAWEALGAIYRDVRLIAAGSIDPAIRYFKKASELEPSNPILLTELGKLYLANNQTNEAAAAFSKATEQKDNYFEAYVGLAKTYDALGQADKALVILEDVIRRQPNPEVVYESGRLYYNQNKIDKAIERFNQAIQMYPEYANAIYSLGLAYQKKGDKINALEQFNQVLKLNPENEGVKAVIEELVGENKAEEAEENE